MRFCFLTFLFFFLPLRVPNIPSRDAACPLKFSTGFPERKKFDREHAFRIFYHAAQNTAGEATPDLK